MNRFTGKQVSEGISLPADLWALLKQRRAQTGVPVSTQVRRAIEDSIFKQAERLVDTRADYTTGGDDA